MHIVVTVAIAVPTAIAFNTTTTNYHESQFLISKSESGLTSYLC